MLKTLSPKLNDGAYVFCTITGSVIIDQTDIVGSFKEKEGLTVILAKDLADKYDFSYTYIAAWITLTVHSSLEAIDLPLRFQPL